MMMMERDGTLMTNATAEVTTERGTSPTPVSAQGVAPRIRRLLGTTRWRASRLAPERPAEPAYAVGYPLILLPT